MPTGYTMMIDDDPTMTTAKWVIEGISRAFGVCVSLRDHGDMTEEQILAHLQERVDNAGSYHKEKLIETKNQMELIRIESEKFFTKTYADYVENTESYNKKSTADAELIKSKHDQVKADLTLLRDTTTDEVTRNIAVYGLEQLERTVSDTEPYITEVVSYEQFKLNKNLSLDRDLTYHVNGLAEDFERERDRFASYITLVSEVNRVLTLSQSKIKETEQ